MKSTFRFATASVLFCAAMALFAPGCGGPSVESLCEQFCACGQECVESSRALCIEGGKEQQERAETAGCADTFDAYLTCLDENFECTGGGPQLPPECESLADEISTCTAEQS